MPCLMPEAKPVMGRLMAFLGHQANTGTTLTSWSVILFLWLFSGLGGVVGLEKFGFACFRSVTVSIVQYVGPGCGEPQVNYR